jgi:hypothetical protein
VRVGLSLDKAIGFESVYEFGGCAGGETESSSQRDDCEAATAAELVESVVLASVKSASSAHRGCGVLAGDVEVVEGEGDVVR